MPKGNMAAVPYPIHFQPGDSPKYRENFDAVFSPESKEPETEPEPKWVVGDGGWGWAMLAENLTRVARGKGNVVIDLKMTKLTRDDILAACRTLAIDVHVGQTSADGWVSVRQPKPANDR